MSALRGPRFQNETAFAPSPTYRLAPFRFGQLDARRYVLTNDVGEYVVLPREDLVALIRHELAPTSPAGRALRSRHFLFDDASACALDLLALKVRTRADAIANFTGLHIFVVTLRCDHTCHYCQVSRQTEDRTAFDLSLAHADQALEFTFRTPSPTVKIEFQGGEPLLAFEVVRHVVERALELNQRHGKDLQFVIASNLARLTDEILAFCKQHSVHLSTSLDGPQDLHDTHRRARGASSHDLALRGIERAREVLGHDAVSALMTTTEASIGRVEEIVDEYLRLGFRGIFLRSLSPYGFAVKTSLLHRYGTEDWLDFYRRGLARVLDINRRGTLFREEYTTILLQKMFSPIGSSYVDLQSPAGMAIGGVVFNYDGAIYASDEGRMLAEMGDTTFRIGHLDCDSWEHVMTSDAVLGPLEETLLESSPMCSDCPFLPFCGADPAFHRATQGDLLGHKAHSGFCKKQMGVLRHLISLMEDDPEARSILMSWV